MRVAIHALGTRGDVQPYIAGIGIDRARTSRTARCSGSVREHGARPRRRIRPLPGEFLALLDTPEGKAAIAGGKGFSAGLKLLKYVRPMMQTLLDAEWKAAQAFNPSIFVHQNDMSVEDNKRIVREFCNHFKT
ncbi:glycosyltransferase [Rhizobium laguerreae]|uniref:Glycosyltransferase family 28 N-terminal domain-containing protein n=1 Tax=Rhizobium laguerreae TaxID=1076926 RepID=A0AAX2Q9Z6_9HYPH|nr:glycosyltransferase [Rhizobium laguerreae]TCU10399.1 hypothetical protein EV131_1493 [Rhizobium laguerreae]